MSVIRQFALRFREFASIDPVNGIVRDVAVITVGPALGHGVEVDATTLAQVKACAETYANGLKVKMTHEGDAGDIVGRLTNFRVEGDQLLADLHLLKNSPHRAYILELAETIPDTFGLSIAFSGPVEEVEEKRFARCTEIYSADLVSEPAANPSGLFDVGPFVKVGDDPALTTQPKHKPTQFEMNPEDIKKVIDEALAPFSARLQKLEEGMQPAIVPEEEKEVEVEMSAKLKETAELAAKAALVEFTKQYGAPVIAPSAEVKAPAKQEVKAFEQLVRDHAEYSSNKPKAIRETIAKHPEAHREYNSRVREGREVVLF